MDYNKLLIASLYFLLGQVSAWFATNSQLVWKWWADKPIFAAIAFGVPATLFFWFGTKYAYQAMNELWGPRFIAFGMSYISFPILTWWLLNESMATPKTMICIFLSCLMIAVQIFWKTST